MAGTILPFNGIWPRIADDAFIAETAVIIGDVEIGPGASIWYGTVIRGDVNAIRIGARTNIQDNAVVHCASDPQGDYRRTGGGIPTILGEDITVGHLALVHACTVEDKAFIGMHSVVMDGAVVESGAMVAAKAMVTPRRRVPSGELWAGSPAKPMRPLTEDDYKEMARSSRDYAKLATRYREGQSG